MELLIMINACKIASANRVSDDDDNFYFIFDIFVIQYNTIRNIWRSSGNFSAP